MRRLLWISLLSLLVCGCVAEDSNAPDATDRTVATNDSSSTEKSMTDYNELTEKEQDVLLQKGTEFRGTGEYTDLDDAGTYICKQCNAPLYNSTHKFPSGCGWPAFDDEIERAITHIPDADGFRTEIVCANCEGHLGHVFVGERFTEKNTRHCVNSISMKFIPEGKAIPETIRPKK